MFSTSKLLKKIFMVEMLKVTDYSWNYFPITLDKSETNSNWLKRPFSDEQLNYAAEDVSYLIEIL